MVANLLAAWLPVPSPKKASSQSATSAVVLDFNIHGDTLSNLMALSFLSLPIQKLTPWLTLVTLYTLPHFSLPLAAQKLPIFLFLTTWFPPGSFTLLKDSKKFTCDGSTHVCCVPIWLASQYKLVVILLSFDHLSFPFPSTDGPGT